MKQWYYIVQDQQQGPVPEDQIVRWFQSGQLSTDTLVWAEGLIDWTPAHTLENLVSPASIPLPLSTPSMPAPPNGVGVSPPPVLLHISLGRLVFMSIVSNGLYEAYWIYKNWRYLKDRDHLKIRPFWRGVFGIFFIGGLFKAIRNDERMNGLEKANFRAEGLALGWILLMLVSNVLGRVDDFRVNMLGIVLALPSFLFFVPVQKYINCINTKRVPKPAYTEWTTGHIVCLVLGLVSWLLILLGIAAQEN